MSTLAMAWAFTIEVSGTAKIVLLSLADIADEEHSCGPQLSYLVRVTGCSTRTVRRQLRALEDQGLLRTEAQTRSSGRQLPNRYYLLLPPEVDWWSRIPEDFDWPVGWEESWDLSPMGGQNDPPHKLGHTGMDFTDMSASPGLCGRSNWPTSISTSTSSNTCLSLVGSKEPPTSSRADRPVCPDMSESVPPRDSRRSRPRKKKIQEEEDQDPVKLAEAKIGESLSAGHVEDPGPVEVRSRQRRGTPGPDTLLGLVNYWNSQMEQTEWGSGLDSTNSKILMAAFSRWKKNGVSAEEIRNMIRRYATDPGVRNKAVIPWKDFLAKRALLLDGVMQQEKAQESESRRNDPSYWRWGQQ